MQSGLVSHGKNLEDSSKFQLDDEMNPNDYADVRSNGYHSPFSHIVYNQGDAKDLNQLQQKKFRPSQGGQVVFKAQNEYVDLEEKKQIDYGMSNVHSQNSLAGASIADISVADRTNYTVKVRGEKKKKKKKRVKFPEEGEHIILASYGPVQHEPDWAVMSEDECNARPGDAEDDGISKSKMLVNKVPDRAQVLRGTFKQQEVAMTRKTSSMSPKQPGLKLWKEDEELAPHPNKKVTWQANQSKQQRIEDENVIPIKTESGFSEVLDEQDVTETNGARRLPLNDSSTLNINDGGNAIQDITDEHLFNSAIDLIIDQQQANGLQVQREKQDIGEEDGRRSRALQTYEDLVNEESTMDRNQVSQFIQSVYPRRYDKYSKKYKKWPLCSGLGSLYGKDCFTKKRLACLAKNLGPAPSLFLLLLQSYIRLFAILSIFSAPACLLLSSGEFGDGMAKAESATSFVQFLSSYSLGNLGPQISLACSETSAAAETSTGDASEEFTTNLQCTRGQLVRIVGIGFAEVKGGQPVCDNVQPAILDSDGTYKVIEERETESKGHGHVVVEYYARFQEDCSSYQSHAFRTSQFVNTIVSQFDEECVNKQQCEISFGKIAGLNKLCEQHLRDNTKSRVDGSGQPRLYVLSICSSDQLKLNGVDLHFTRDEASMFLIALSIALTSLFLLTFNILGLFSKEYSRQLMNLTLHLSDFTLVMHVPEAAGGRDDLTTKLSIFSYLQEVLSLAADRHPHLCPSSLDRDVVEITIARRKPRDQKKDKIRKLVEDVVDAEVKTRMNGKEDELKDDKHSLESTLKQLREQIADVDKEEETLEDVRVVYVTFASRRTKEVIEKLLCQRGLHKCLRLSQLNSDPIPHTFIQDLEEYMQTFAEQRPSSISLPAHPSSPSTSGSFSLCQSFSSPPTFHAQPYEPADLLAAPPSPQSLSQRCPSSLLSLLLAALVAAPVALVFAYGSVMSPVNRAALVAAVWTLWGRAVALLAALMETSRSKREERAAEVMVLGYALCVGAVVVEGLGMFDEGGQRQDAASTKLMEVAVTVYLLPPFILVPTILLELAKYFLFSIITWHDQRYQSKDFCTRQPKASNLKSLYASYARPAPIGALLAVPLSTISQSILLSTFYPLAAPIALLTLLVYYSLLKFLLLRFYPREPTLLPSTILAPFSHLGVLTISLHFLLMLTQLFHPSLSPILHSERSQTVHFEQSGFVETNGQAASAAASVASSPAGTYPLIGYCSLVVILYMFNLFVINPLTCCLQEGCCFEVRGRIPDEQDEDDDQQASRVKIGLGFEVGRATEEAVREKEIRSSQCLYKGLNLKMAEAIIRDGVEEEMSCYARLEVVREVVRAIRSSSSNDAVASAFTTAEQQYARYFEQLQKRRSAIEGEVNELWGYVLDNLDQDGSIYNISRDMDLQIADNYKSNRASGHQQHNSAFLRSAMQNQPQYYSGSYKLEQRASPLLADMVEVAKVFDTSREHTAPQVNEAVKNIVERSSARLEESHRNFEYQLAKSVDQSLARIRILLSKYNEELLCSKYKPHKSPAQAQFPPNCQQILHSYNQAGRNLFQIAPDSFKLALPDKDVYPVAHAIIRKNRRPGLKKDDEHV